ncbi:hypothetical protein COJ27_26010 [Bacillus cereus]|nr:hypothetical protein COJ27_26010 [Bacillus cereus]
MRIYFELQMRNINQVINPPVGSADFLAKEPMQCALTSTNVCNWVPKSFFAKLDSKYQINEKHYRNT